MAQRLLFTATTIKILIINKKFELRYRLQKKLNIVVDYLNPFLMVWP